MGGMAAQAESPPGRGSGLHYVRGLPHGLVLPALDTKREDLPLAPDIGTQGATACPPHGGGHRFSAGSEDFLERRLHSATCRPARPSSVLCAHRLNL